MNLHTQSTSVEARPGRHGLFSDSVRFVLAPLVLLFTGFFTANFLISSSYTWPRTSQMLALTLTMLVLSRTEAPEHTWAAPTYSCARPYVIGVVVMPALWAL